MSFSDGGTALPPNPFTALEQIRRRQGALLEASGWGPVQSDSEILVSRPCMRVRSYQPAGGGGPPVLLVPAPIKRAYIWDLEPSRSPVRLLSEAGFSVHLVEWMDPGPEERGLGLGDYAGDLLLAAAEAVRFATDQVPTLVGHSLGGTFAALLAALRPDLVRGLGLLEAPLRFGADAGAFAPVVGIAPDAEWAKVVFGNVPGSFISIASATAAPVTFHLERYLDFLTTVRHPPFQIHMCVERWTLDEMAMPGQLFEDIVEELYRHDRLMQGQLVLGGRRIGPERVGCPLLTVLNRRAASPRPSRSSPSTKPPPVVRRR
jgi:polyhydroxyalkanoate synthase